MLFNFPELIKKHNIQFKGLIHVGAHDCSEIILYAEAGIEKVSLIEANPKRADRLSYLLYHNLYVISSYPFRVGEIPEELRKIINNYHIYNYIACNKHGDKMKLNITNFDGGLDSIFNLNSYGVSTCWAPFKKIDEVEVPTITLDDFYIKSCGQKGKYNFLNIDVEGAELLVLQGATELLTDDIEYILVETQEKYRFDGSCLHGEIVEYLARFGFKQVDYYDTGKEWGDALFIKEKK